MMANLILILMAGPRWCASTTAASSCSSSICSCRSFAFYHVQPLFHSTSLAQGSYQFQHLLQKFLAFRKEWPLFPSRFPILLQHLLPHLCATASSPFLSSLSTSHASLLPHDQ
uniref:Putative secreted protein n=1 Tax=Panstrongylus lignarius TaxID=156445 RepID=A0A224Y2C8_9HEMI